jgi:hypothetical protein
MKRALLIGVLILSIFFFIGCIVICCEENRTVEKQDAICAPEE